MHITAAACRTEAFEGTRWVARLQKRLQKLLSNLSSETARSGALDRDTFARITSPRGRRISCVSGALWLTFDGEPQDTVLEAGQSIVCERDAPLLISSFEKSTWRAV